MKTNFSIELGRKVIFNGREGSVLHRFRYAETVEAPGFNTEGNFYVVGFKGGNTSVCFEGQLFKLPTEAESRAKQVETREKAAGRKAKRLAKQYGITLERLHPGGPACENWVFPPEGKFSNFDNEDRSKPVDPFDGDHATYDWSECLKKVLVYVEALKSSLTAV